MTNHRSTQSQEIKAAVVRKKGGPFQIETLTLEEPRPDQVLIRIVATGMCHSRMVARDQLYTVPMPGVSYCGRPYPIIKRLRARLGDGLRFVFRHFPLIHKQPLAQQAAEAAEAADAQGRF
jgi:hypothetical protein